MDELKMRHPALEKILEIVQINDDDKPDTAHEI